MFKRVSLFAVFCMFVVFMIAPAAHAANPSAKAESSKKITYVTYGQPDDWANWAGVFEKFNAKYGCNRVDTDMSSAEEITKFKAERNNPQADSAEIGMGWGPIAVSQGVTMP